MVKKLKLFWEVNYMAVTILLDLGQAQTICGRVNLVGHKCMALTIFSNFAQAQTICGGVKLVFLNPNPVLQSKSKIKTKLDTR